VPVVWKKGTYNPQVRFDRNYIGEDRNASAAVPTSYDVDTTWYVDSGATDHITVDLKKLTICDKYLGHDQVHTTNSSGMAINQVGDSVIHTPSCDLALKHVLYIPEASKNLISMHHFTYDNHVFLELTHDIFLLRISPRRGIFITARSRRGCIIEVSKEAGPCCHQALPNSVE
jgi:hypothetical protein